MSKYFVLIIVLFFFVSCGFVEESNFLQNSGTVITGGNNPPTLGSIAMPTIFAGVTTSPIDANDINTGSDIDIDGEAVTYTCRYDNTIDGVVGAGIGDCTSLTNEDGSSPSFDSSMGVFSGWSPPLNTIGTAFEFEIVGTDPNAASSSVIFSGIVLNGSPSAWLQGTQTTSSTNVNQTTPFALEWSSSTFDPVYFDHSTSVNPEELRVNVAGNYFISVTVPMTSTIQRACVRAEIRVNGSAVNGGIGESSYIRSTSGHNESSNHVAMLLESLVVDDVIEIFVSATALAGTVTIDSSASLYVEYIRPGRTLFTATATQTTSGPDLNLGPAASLEWTEGLKSSGFTHDDGSNPENIILDQAGDYLVFVNVPLNLPGAQIRTNVRLLIQDDGVTVPGGEGQQGYIRNASGHIDASVHWSGLIRNVGAGSILTVKTQQEGETGTVNVQSGQTASLLVEKVDSSINLFFSRATRLTGPSTNWNPNSALDILWENDVITYASDFTHSTTVNPNQITVNNDGDYLLIYNDSFNSAVQRANPKITVNINGSPINGAETKSHYIRSGSLHTESSGTLVFFLEGLSSGDIISMSSVAEAVTGTVDDNQDSLLILWRKR